MPLRLAINGYGRIGRCFLRALLDSPVAHQLQVLALHEPAHLESIAYSTRTHTPPGRFTAQLDLGNNPLLPTRT